MRNKVKFNLFNKCKICLFNTIFKLTRSNLPHLEDIQVSSLSVILLSMLTMLLSTQV